MPFNSDTGAEAGRKSRKGAHKKTAQWEALHEAIITTHAERFNRVLTEMNDEDFAKMFKDILNYFKPRIVHNINENPEPTVIQVQNLSGRYHIADDGSVTKLRDDED